MKINSKKEEEKDNIQFKRKYASIPTIEINRILLFRKKNIYSNLEISVFFLFCI